MRTSGLRRPGQLVQHQHQQVLGRRHGSQAPGPLEARRRASRRKYAAPAALPVSAAPTEVGNLLPFDPAVRRGERQNQTQTRNGRTARPGLTNSNIQPTYNPRPPGSTHAPPATLPLWLTDALNALKGVEAQQNTHPSIKTPRLEQLSKELQSCGDLEAMQRAASRLSLSLSNPLYSKAAFERLMDLCPGHENVVRFLSNRSINPPAAYNATGYLCALTKRAQHSTVRKARFARKDIRRFRNWTEQEIQLGNMAEEEIRDMLRYTAANRKRLVEIHPELFWKQVMSIYQGLHASTVRPIQQLQPATVRRFLRTAAMSSGTCIQTRSQLAKELIKAACLHKHDLCPTYIRAFLSTMAVDLVSTTNSVAAGDGHEVLQSNIPVPGTPISSLSINAISSDTLPEDMERMVQKHWTNAFLELSDSFKAPENYSNSKRVISQQRLQSLFSAASNETVASLMQKLPPSASITFFIAYFKHTVSSNTSGEGSHASPHSVLSTSFTAPSGTGLLPLIDNLPQSHRPRYIELLASVYRHHRDATMLEGLVSYCHLHGHRLPVATLTSLVNSLACEEPARALSLFLQSKNLRIEYCVPLAAAIVASPSIPHDTVFTLLEWSLRYQASRSPRSHEANPVLVRFLHKLAAMLSEATGGSATDRAALVERTLALFETRPELMQPSLMRSFLRAQVRSYIERDVSIEGEAKREILAKLESLRLSAPVDHVLDLVEKAQH